MFVKFMGQAQKYRNAETGGEGGGSGGGAAIDLNNPDLQKVIQAQVEQAVNGLKNKNSELLGKLKETQEKAKMLDGVDIAKVQALQKQLEENEELRLMAEGKVEDVVNRRLENYKKDHENQLQARDNKLAEYEKILKQKEERLASLVIDGQIREAYVSLGFEPAAIDDVLRLGREVYIMDDTGRAVPRDENGNVIFSKDAKNPVSASEWLQSLAEKKPYLRGVSKGAGTQPNRGSKTVDMSKLSSAQRIAEGLKQRGFV